MSTTIDIEASPAKVPAPAPAKTIAMCAGCSDDFYNGNNAYGIKRCWTFTKATVEKRIKVGVWERPPYRADRAQYTLSCHKPKGYVQVKPDALTEEGYWKS
jgi:hypothetical protein